MMQRLQIHPRNPQERLIRQVAKQFQGGALVALPTDASYVLACHLDDKAAVERMRAVRGIDDKHLLTLICRDLSELSQYAQVDNRQFRFLKEWTPGAYTFILPATKEVPKRLMHPSRKTLGLRVPDAPIVQALIAELGEPLLCASLILPGDEDPLVDPDDIEDRIGKRIDLLVDGGAGSLVPTTVIDVTGDEPVIIRTGLGPVDAMLK
ncbi:MAG: L-threonylcarbamoyladenylate synthase [Lautropia sp.]|nr:L-threonylcarbamoyladenylate synthase [Lautropia sp.]